MAARILAYTARMYPKLVRGGELPSDGRLPPVLPAVIHNGERRWSAAAQIALKQGSVPAMASVLRRVSALLSGEEHASLRRAAVEKCQAIRGR